MNFFANLIPGAKDEPKSVGTSAVPSAVSQADAARTADERPVCAKFRTGRTKVYAVRMRESFKGEILGVQAEIPLERQKVKGKARKVTESEVIELMLDAFKAARRNWETVGHVVSIANDVWVGVHEIARRLQCSPAEVVERLVMAKIDELDLLPQK